MREAAARFNVGNALGFSFVAIVTALLATAAYALAAALRRPVVVSARPSALAVEPASATLKTSGIEQPSLFGQMKAQSCFDAGKMRRKPWAWLLRHVFAIDVTECPECSGKMRWQAVALTPEAIAEGLARVGFSARGPPRRPRAPRGQLSLPFPR